MENFDESHLGGVPERFRQEGIKAHYSELVRTGDIVEAIRDIGGGEISRGMKAKIIEVVVTPNLNGKRGFTKRIRLEGFEGDFNPQRFKKVKE
jgi:hypothetical protein